MAKEYDDMVSSNAIYEAERLIYWDKSINVDEKLIKSMETIKETVDYMKSKVEESGIATIFSNIDDNPVYIGLFTQYLNKSGMILSRNALNWIEDIDNYDIRQTLLLMISFTETDFQLVKALLENQELFYKFIVGQGG